MLQLRRADSGAMRREMPHGCVAWSAKHSEKRIRKKDNGDKEQTKTRTETASGRRLATFVPAAISSISRP